jgi:hypothetical protein
MSKPDKATLEKRLDEHYAAVTRIECKALSENRQLSRSEILDRKFHLAEILVLKKRLWDEFEEPEFKAETGRIIKAETDQTMLDEISSFEEKYNGEE